MAAAALAALLGAVATSFSQTTGGVEGRTTVEQRIVPEPGDGFRPLKLGPGEGYVVREEGVGAAQPGRERRRRSLLYFGQLSDFQLADEESPARVEFLDPADNPAPFSSAWRPMEPFTPHVVDAAIEQMNRFADRSPLTAADGSRARMRFAITTGDSADNQQRNETEWVVRLLEGGTLNPNSGSSNPADYPADCPPPAFFGDEPARYTGVQDYDDYQEGADPPFYDPDDPRGSKFAGWPKYPGLLDRAQVPFRARGLKVPSYVAIGNHDGLVQGNEDANRSFEDVAINCKKPLGPAQDARDLGSAIANTSPGSVAALAAADPSKVALVPPDPNRQFVSKPQYKALHATGAQRDAHGFAFVDPEESRASNGAAGYYAWSPSPGFRFISVDTVSEGGVTGPSSDGNVDDPQFRWIERELKRASDRDELIFLFSHHAIASLEANVPDEAAPPCNAGDDGHGHDQNPGCDLDPRDSEPIHLGDDLVQLFHRYPHVVGFVSGHSHVNNVVPFKNPSGRGGFWNIRTAAEIDWPQQNRLLEVMDNDDGTLSIFGTILDHASPVAAPASPAPPEAVAGFGVDELASIGRTLAFNDPQSGAPNGEGQPRDRNVELLVQDPRRKTSEPGRPGVPGVPGVRPCASAVGSLRGYHLGRAKLGFTRGGIRRIFGRTVAPRPSVDRLCLRGGGTLRIGYPTRKLLRGLRRSVQRRVRERAVLLLTSSRRYSARGVRAGSSLRTLRRQIRGLSAFRVGANTWYLRRGRGGARLVFKVRGGRVRELGLADGRLTASRRPARRFLGSF